MNIKFLDIAGCVVCIDDISHLVALPEPVKVGEQLCTYKLALKSDPRNGLWIDDAEYCGLVENLEVLGFLTPPKDE